MPPREQNQLNFPHNVRIRNVEVMFNMRGRKHGFKLHDGPISNMEPGLPKMHIHSFAHTPGPLPQHCDPVAYQTGPLHRSSPTPQSPVQEQKVQARVVSAYVTVHDASVAYGGVGSVEMATYTLGHVSDMPELAAEDLVLVLVLVKMSNVGNPLGTPASTEVLEYMPDA
jgi:hypothetical protein